MGISGLLVGGRHAVGVNGAYNANHRLACQGRGLHFGPHRIGAVGIYAYEAAVAPCAVAVKIIAYFRFGRLDRLRILEIDIFDGRGIYLGGGPVEMVNQHVLAGKIIAVGSLRKPCATCSEEKNNGEYIFFHYL